MTKKQRGQIGVLTLEYDYVTNRIRLYRSNYINGEFNLYQIYEILWTERNRRIVQAAWEGYKVRDSFYSAKSLIRHFVKLEL